MSKSTIKASIIEAGNGLPYLGDLVYSGETNMVYKITACSRVQVNGNGKGNSVDVTLIEAGDPDDYTETAFAEILDCQVDLEEEIDHSDYTVKVSDEPSYYGSECSQDDADEISDKLCEMIERQFPPHKGAGFSVPGFRHQPQIKMITTAYIVISSIICTGAYAIGLAHRRERRRLVTMRQSATIPHRLDQPVSEIAELRMELELARLQLEAERLESDRLRSIIRESMR